MGDFEEALANFNDTLLYLRGNKYIDYEQLGLKFKLYSCEVLFNRGLCYIYLHQLEAGMQDLTFAAKEKAVPDHDVIEEAIREQAEGYTVFSIPVGVVYRPNDAKVKNLRAKDYLGKAKLVATTDNSNAFTGFTGAEIKRMNSVSAAKDDRPEANISFAASNLVKPDIKSSRYRQQSEPPPNRDMFPPTPPPDTDRASGSSSSGATRTESLRGGPPKLKPLDLSAAGFERSSGNGRPDLSRTLSDRSAGGRSRGTPSGNGNGSNNGTSRRPSLGASRSDSGRSPVQQQEYDDVYDMYGRAAAATGANNPRPRAGTNSRTTPGYISEEEEEGSYDEPDFEMISNRNSGRRQQMRRSVPEVRKIRVKVHADDTRYVMVGAAVEFKDFVDQIRTKFGIRQNFKVKIKDDGDMITMSDQDDLEMAIMQSKSDAKKERNEMGKMEVSFG
jgi:PB1 domain